MDWSIVLQIVIGASITIGVVVFVEYFRKPNIEVRIADPVDNTYTGRPATKRRALMLLVENKQLPLLVKWLARNAAIHCSGVIAFHHLDGQNVFGRTMQARWSHAPEPLPILAVADGIPLIKILDPVRLDPEMHKDIYPGESEELDVASRFDNDGECYGWCNGNYTSNPLWRNPDWKLDKGRYLIKVEVMSAGARCIRLFRLINDVPVNAFRLEKAQPDDRKKVCKKT